MSQNQKNFFLNPLEKRYWLTLNELERLNKRQSYAIQSGHLDDLSDILDRIACLLQALLDLEKRIDHLDKSRYRYWFQQFHDQHSKNQQAFMRLRDDLDQQLVIHDQKIRQKKQFIHSYGL